MKPNHTKSPKASVKFVYFSIFTFTLILTLSIGFYAVSQHSIRNRRLSFIENYALLTDNNIQTNLYDYLQDAFSRPITSLDTLSYFFETDKNDSEYFFEIRLDLHNHHLIKRVFQDIILFRVSDSAFVSATRAGYNINDTYSQNSLSYADLHELLTLTRKTEPMLYITENSRTYYLYPIYLNNNQVAETGSYYAGFCAIWLDADSFFNLNALKPQDNGTTLIINGNDIIYANGKNVLSNEAIFNITDKFAKEGKSCLYETLFSTNYSFFCQKSETSGLTYLYYEPITDIPGIFFNFSEPAAIIYWMCIPIIILSVAAFIIMQLKNSPPTLLQRKENLHNNENYIFKNAFDLLYGNTSSGSLNETLKNIINTQTPYKYTSCIIIEPEPLAMLKMTAEQKSDFIKEITTSIDMHLDNTSTDTHYTIMHYPNNLITCIINSASFMPENLAHNILEQLNDLYDSQFNVFCTTPTISLSELSRNYAIILDSRKYAFIYSYNNVFTQDTIELYEAADDMIDTGLTAKIHDLITQEYFEELTQYLRNLPTVIRQRGFSCIRIKDHYRIIFNIINDYCKENQPDYPYKDMPLSDIINQFETIDECSDFLCDEINLLAASIEEKKKELENNAGKKYIDHIIEYIDKNIETVSLTLTAEHFNISVAHLSRIFKELTGTNFSDYVADKKLQQAAALLINDRNISIGDIAKNLGYNTPAYFSRKFKEHFEVTPATYRKQHINDN